MNVLEKILEEIEEYRKNNNPIANRTASEIEEIIRSHKDDVLKCNECKRRKWYQIGFIDGFKAQPEKWIPISSGELPPENEDVFITYEDKDNPDERYVAITQYREHFLGTFSIGEQWIPPFDYFSENYKIVAYQPLPEPYKGGTEK